MTDTCTYTVVAQKIWAIYYAWQIKGQAKLHEAKNVKCAADLKDYILSINDKVSSEELLLDVIFRLNSIDEGYDRRDIQSESQAYQRAKGAGRRYW